MDGKIASRTDEITDEMWKEVCEFNRNMVEEYLGFNSVTAIKVIFRTGLSEVMSR